MFAGIIDDLTELSNTLSISKLFEAMLEATGYIEALKAEGDEGLDRIDNVKEFATTIAQYENETEEPSLSDFLEQIALVTDIDALDTNADKVVLMTIHSAKGLEFNNVYLVGLEEGIFPGNQSIMGGNAEIEEERRLAYVAITRAKKRLTVTNTYMRMMFGSTTRNAPSRFLKEIPLEFCHNDNVYVRKANPVFTENKKSYSGNSFASSFVSGSKPTVNTVSNANYTVGQIVNHKTFGQGMILSVTPAGNDTLLEIAFDKVGTKKLMANFAKLT
jgi:DNA helicase-2/ATP-dependent DNA helicase PcrA